MVRPEIIKKNNNKIINILLILVLFGLSGCNHSQHYLRRFPVIKKSNSFFQTQDEITLAIRALSISECSTHFGVNLINKDFIPLQIRIENRTPDTFIIRPSYISLDIANPSYIAKLLHWDTSMWVSTGSCLSLLFWWPGLVTVTQAGHGMYKTNKYIDYSITDTSLQENQSIRILPYEIFNKFIFVHKDDYIPRFTFKLFNTNKRKLINFDVNITGQCAPLDYNFITC